MLATLAGCESHRLALFPKHLGGSGVDWTTTKSGKGGPKYLFADIFPVDISRNYFSGELELINYRLEISIIYEGAGINNLYVSAGAGLAN